MFEFEKQTTNDIKHFKLTNTNSFYSLIELKMGNTVIQEKTFNYTSIIPLKSTLFMD